MVEGYDARFLERGNILPLLKPPDISKKKDRQETKAFLQGKV